MTEIVLKECSTSQKCARNVENVFESFLLEATRTLNHEQQKKRHKLS